MRRSRIRELIPVKAPTRPLHIATAAELGISEKEFRQKLLTTAAVIIFVPGPGRSLVRRLVEDDATAEAFHRAIALLRRLLRDEPDHATAWSLLGAACEAINDQAEAGRAYGRAHELDPENADAAQGIFWWAMNSRDYGLAHTAAMTVSAAIPDDIAVQLRVAHVEIMRERFDDAERTIESIASRFPGDPRAPALAAVLARYRNGSLSVAADYEALCDDHVEQVIEMAIDGETD